MDVFSRLPDGTWVPPRPRISSVSSLNSFDVESRWGGHVRPARRFRGRVAVLQLHTYLYRLFDNTRCLPDEGRAIPGHLAQQRSAANPMGVNTGQPPLVPSKDFRDY